MMRVGVVGFGYWGSKHVRVLSALGVEVVVIERDPNQLDYAREAFPHLRHVDDLLDVVDDLDAVVIATAPSTHAPLARIALHAGLHVLVEKPLATSSEDAVALIDLAEQNDCTLMVGHTFEYNPAVLMLRDLVDRGELGPVRYVDSARLNLGLYQRDVNVIWDLAPHDISITNFILGTTPARVSAWATTHTPTDVEDVAYLQLEYRQPDVTSYVHVSWLDPKKVRRVTVVGANKMAVYNDVDAHEPIRIHDVGVDWDADAQVQDRPIAYRYGDILSPRVSGVEPLVAEDRHFIDCCRTGATPRSGGTSGLSVVRTIEAAAVSIANGGVAVEVEPVIDLRTESAVPS